MGGVKRFALLGAAGFVAPRHMRAIRDTGHDLVAAMDPRDSVGVLDSYFPDARFFTEIERLDRHLEMLRRNGEPVDYVSVCTPNYLHDAHCRLALRLQAHAICEKPLVLHKRNVDQLAALERETGQRVHPVLQLRYHRQLIALRQRAAIEVQRVGRLRVEIDYITRRGDWYLRSWKGRPEQSGGLAANIGVHLFDALLWMFGAVDRYTVTADEPTLHCGELILERADVLWRLSVDEDYLPDDVRAARGHCYRWLKVNSAPVVDLSEGFGDLHIRVYEEILAGRGLGLEDARPAIALLERMRRDRSAVMAA